MRVGFSSSNQDSSIRVTQERARLAEEAGFDVLTCGDSQSIFREVYCQLTACALVTERVLLGTTVTNPLTRHPVITASAIATVDDASDGRAFLGIGAGQSATGTLGLPSARIADVEEHVVAVRAALDPERRSDAPRGRVEWSRRAVPIMIHAAGPASVGLATRQGDGILLRLGDLDEAGLAARIGELRARRPQGFEVWLYAPTGIAADRADAAAMVAAVVSARALTTKIETIPEELRDAHREFSAGYDYAHHASTANPVNFELLARVGLDGYMTERLACVGTPPEVGRWLDRMEGIGVDVVLLGGSVPDPEGFIADAGRILAARQATRRS